MDIQSQKEEIVKYLTQYQSKYQSLQKESKKLEEEIKESESKILMENTHLNAVYNDLLTLINDDNQKLNSKEKKKCEELTEIIKANIDFVDKPDLAYHVLGCHALKMGDNVNAIVFFEEARKLRPADVRVLTLLVHLYRRQKNDIRSDNMLIEVSRLFSIQGVEEMKSYLNEYMREYSQTVKGYIDGKDVNLQKELKNIKQYVDLKKREQMQDTIKKAVVSGAIFSIIRMFTVSGF